MFQGLHILLKRSCSGIDVPVQFFIVEQCPHRSLSLINFGGDGLEVLRRHIHILNRALHIVQYLVGFLDQGRNFKRSLASNRIAAVLRRGMIRPERDFDILVTDEAFGLDVRHGIFLDNVASGVLQIHFDGHLLVRTVRQVNAPHRSLMNPANAHFRAIG